MRNADLYTKIRDIDKKIEYFQNEVLDLYIQKEKIFESKRIMIDDDVRRLNQRLKVLKEELNRLGPINFQAENSFSSVQTELVAWKKQKDNILTDVKTLEDRIQELQKIKRTKFLTEIKRISRLFSYYCIKLSGGSVKAELVVRYTKKNRKKIKIQVWSRGIKPPFSTLSAGESAVIAISLLFSLQETSATKFIIMDEIDSHLDRQTTKRLGKVLRDLSSNQQVIITSLRPEILGYADKLHRIHVRELTSHVVSEEKLQRENKKSCARAPVDNNRFLIKRLEVKDFMAHRNSSLELSPNLNIVTGPNGSGKTSLLFAIRHCLGQNVFRRNAQLIHHYPKSSQATYAEVSLVFDNHNRRLPINADEVIIRRKTKKKRSVWSLNGRKIKIKEITDLFEKAEINFHFPTIIPQQFLWYSNKILGSSYWLSKILERFIGTRSFDSEIDQMNNAQQEKEKKIVSMKPLIESHEKFLKKFYIERKQLEKWRKIKAEIQTLRHTLEKRVKIDLEKNLSEKEKILDNLKIEKGRLLDQLISLEESTFPIVLKKYYDFVDASLLNTLVKFSVNVVLKKREEGERLGICFVVLKAKKIPEIFDKLKDEFIQIPLKNLVENWESLVPILGFLDPSIRCIVVNPEGIVVGTLKTPTLRKAFDLQYLEFLFAEKKDVPYISISLQMDGLILLKSKVSDEIKIFDRGILVARYINNSWESNPSDVRKNLLILTSITAEIQKELRLDPNLLSLILNTAIEMSYQRLGAIFMIGDHESVLDRSSKPSFSQLIRLRNCNLNLLERKELVNLAKQDGAVVIDNKGVIRGVGVILRPKPETVAEVYPGDGARHTSAAKITAETRASAIVVSHDGPISIYYKGKRLFREKHEC